MNGSQALSASRTAPQAHVPHTAQMDSMLDRLEASAKIVGVHHGLPVVRYAKSGRRMVLTTVGRLERLR